jgi:hypothetical protein
VGWTQMPIPPSRKLSLPYAPFRWNWDPFMSALDDALYEYASARVQGIVEPTPPGRNTEAIKNYFDKGPSRRCLAPCCHVECSPVE